MSGGKEIDSTSLQAFVDRLRVTFLQPEVRGYRLHQIRDPPSTPSPRTMASATEIVDLAQPAATGADYIFAQRSGEAGLYEIDGNTVKELRQASGDIKEAQTGAKKK